jgi:hypothetical protein
MRLTVRREVVITMRKTIEITSDDFTEPVDRASVNDPDTDCHPGSPLLPLPIGTTRRPKLVGK